MALEQSWHVRVVGLTKKPGLHVQVFVLRTRLLTQLWQTVAELQVRQMLGHAVQVKLGYEAAKYPGRQL